MSLVWTEKPPTADKQPKQMLLPCKIGPGQFSSESSVVLTYHDGRGDSMFCPNEYIVDGKYMRVELKGADQQGIICFVKLPQKTLGADRPYAFVKLSDLVEIET